MATLVANNLRSPITSSIVGLAGLLALLSCAALDDNMQGPLQPQEVSGPCDVKKFFLLELRSAPAEFTIKNTGDACTMLLINPALNRVVNASLLTTPAEHGRAETMPTSGNRQVLVRYTPAPGFVGKDRFAITIQPNNFGVTYDVTVQPPR